MNRNVSGSLPVIMMLLAFSFVGDRLAGQSPNPLPPFPETGLPQGFSSPKLTPQSPGSGTQKKIRDVLQGHQPAPTGDGVLEDVLGVIQRQGSVLDGSVLDGSVLDGSVLDVPPLPEISIAGHSQNRLSAATQRALVAEQLLRAARMLQQISKDEFSAALVVSMRRQAGELLVAGESPNQ